MEIKSDVTIPILDEPITDIEIKSAWKGMKKSGFVNIPQLYFSKHVEYDVLLQVPN